ncbi:MAG: hypothetical protein LBU64_01400 [Planctomycetota bacterium]|jgi:hypothetical protein|nr:hypothetical protein [Planctomycetota bacterium]
MKLIDLVNNFLDDRERHPRRYPGLRNLDPAGLLRDENPYSLLRIHPEADGELTFLNPEGKATGQAGKNFSRGLAHSIGESLRGAPNKKAARTVYEAFIAYLRGRHSLVPEIDWPPVDAGNRFERILFIAKYLQDPENDIHSLADILKVSERTIEDDLRILRGRGEDYLQVSGRIFKIGGMERRRGRVEFDSTAHPLFLIPNLTQAILLLEGLRAMSLRQPNREAARRTAAEIWNQLSAYAKARIRRVREKLFPGGAEWYEELESMDGEEGFLSEAACGRLGRNVVMDCLKNGKSCLLRFRENREESKFYENCRITRIEGDFLNFECGGRTFEKKFSDLLDNGYSKDDFFEN